MNGRTNERQKDTRAESRAPLRDRVPGAGILGFIPGITTNYDDLKFAGTDSGAELLGLFQVSILHNIVHLLFGVGILMARTHPGALNYLLGAGVIYVVLFIYGLLVGNTSDANFVPINNADDWLHIVLAAGLLIGYLVSRSERRETVAAGI